MKRLLLILAFLAVAIWGPDAQAEIRVQNGYSSGYTPTRVYRYSYTPAYNPYAQGNSGYGYYGYNPYTGQLGQSGYYPPPALQFQPVYPMYQQPSFYNGNSMYYVPYGAYGR